jgi:hypothetical protein
MSSGLVNVLKIARARSLAELADLGVARVSYASLLHHQAMQQFTDLLASLGAELPVTGTEPPEDPHICVVAPLAGEVRIWWSAAIEGSRRCALRSASGSHR